MDIEGWDDSLAAEGIPNLSDNGFKRRKCNERGRNDDKAQKDDPKYCSSQKRLDAKSVYQTAGIYFSLLMKCKHESKSGLGIWQKQKVDIYSKFTFRYKPKCGSIVSAQSTTWPLFAFENLDIHVYRPYHSSKSLSRYELDAYYYVADVCGIPGSIIVPDISIISAGW